MENPAPTRNAGNRIGRPPKEEEQKVLKVFFRISQTLLPHFQRWATEFHEGAISCATRAVLRDPRPWKVRLTAIQPLKERDGNSLRASVTVSPVLKNDLQQLADDLYRGEIGWAVRAILEHPQLWSDRLEKILRNGVGPRKRGFRDTGRRVLPDDLMEAVLSFGEENDCTGLAQTLNLALTDHQKWERHKRAFLGGM